MSMPRVLDAIGKDGIMKVLVDSPGARETGRAAIAGSLHIQHDDQHGVGGHEQDPILVPAGRLDVDKFVSHHFKLGNMLAAYDAFGRAARTKALNVVIER